MVTNTELLDKAIEWLTVAEQAYHDARPVEHVQTALNVARGYTEASTELRQVNRLAATGAKQNT